MTQSHLIVKEEGICIYRVPEKPKESDFTKRGLNIVSFHTEEFSAALEKWYRERDAAPDSAILCEDQERCKFLILEQLGKIGSTWSCHTNAYWQREVAYETIKIGSIYPVPGIEFTHEWINPCITEKRCLNADIETCKQTCKRLYIVARLIEHTAPSELAAEKFERFVMIDTMIAPTTEKEPRITRDQWLYGKSPEIDKEEELLIWKHIYIDFRDGEGWINFAERMSQQFTISARKP